MALSLTVAVWAFQLTASREADTSLITQSFGVYTFNSQPLARLTFKRL